MKTIDELIRLIRDRKEANQKPYVLLLGAGASMPSGLAGSSELIDRIIGNSSKLIPEERKKTFESKWNKCSIVE